VFAQAQDTGSIGAAAQIAARPSYPPG